MWWISYQLESCTSPLQLIGLMLYLYGSGCLPTRTNSWYLYLPSILFQPLGDPATRLGYPLDFLVIDHLFCPLCRVFCHVLFNVHWFVAHISSYCSLTQALLNNTHHRPTGTTPTSYHKGIKPCFQIWVDIAGTQLLHEALHYKQTKQHSGMLAN